MPEIDTNLINTLLVRELSKVYFKFMGDDVMLIDMPKLTHQLFERLGVQPVRTQEQLAASFPRNEALDGKWEQIQAETAAEIAEMKRNQANPLAIQFEKDDSEEVRAVAANMAEAQRKILAERVPRTNQPMQVVPIPTPVLEDLLIRANAGPNIDITDTEFVHGPGHEPVSQAVMTNDELSAIDRIGSMAEWEQFVTRITAKYGGFPANWFVDVILSGKLVLASARWNK